MERTLDYYESTARAREIRRSSVGARGRESIEEGGAAAVGFPGRPAGSGVSGRGDPRRRHSPPTSGSRAVTRSVVDGVGRAGGDLSRRPASGRAPRRVRRRLSYVAAFSRVAPRAVRLIGGQSPRAPRAAAAPSLPPADPRERVRRRPPFSHLRRRHNEDQAAWRSRLTAAPWTSTLLRATNRGGMALFLPGREALRRPRATDW